jgi:hypothetical protein
MAASMAEYKKTTTRIQTVPTPIASPITPRRAARGPLSPVPVLEGLLHGDGSGKRRERNEVLSTCGPTRARGRKRTVPEWG